MGFYWQRVLKEYLNRYEPGFDFYFTNLHPPRNLRCMPKMSKPKAKTKTKIESKCLEKNCYYLGDRFPDTYFTRRELECLIELSKGKTISKTATTLGISSRTVEFYVKKLREKLSCQSKPELLEKVAEYELLAKLMPEFYAQDSGILNRL